MSTVYLDHNATSPIRPEVYEVFAKALRDSLGNASSVHASGRRARQKLDEARERVANALGVLEEELVFTSGGTEADNLALLGCLRKLGTGAGLVTTVAEHAAVLGAAAALEREGHPVQRVRVDAEGLPDVDELVAAASKPEARLVSVMAVNNEVGSRPDLATLGQQLHSIDRPERPFFHTDAVQALGRVPVDLRGWGVDLASFSAHKLGGPAGVGILFRRKGLALQSLAFGGEHEATLRPGTENVPAILAASVAVEMAVREQVAFGERCRELGELFWSQVRGLFPGSRLLGPKLDDSKRSPNTVNVLLPDVDGRVLVTRLDLAGLQVSAGSACASGSLEPSHVLVAMGLDEEQARSGLRVSFGPATTRENVHDAVQILSATLGVTS